MNVAAAYRLDHFDDFDEVVTRYTPLVKRIAYHLKGRLPESVQVEDLIQSGMVGLLEATRNFDQEQGASFETFAGIRIRGAMLDDIRKHDWAPRSTYSKSRDMASAIREVEERELRDAQPSEIAAVMGVSLEEYFRIAQDAASHRILSFEEIGMADSSADGLIPDHKEGVLERLQREDMQRYIARSIAELPEREQLVMVLYYDEELNLREIGTVLGVTESRVCQIHAQALARIRGCLDEEMTNSMLP